MNTFNQQTNKKVSIFLSSIVTENSVKKIKLNNTWTLPRLEQFNLGIALSGSSNGIEFSFTDNFMEQVLDYSPNKIESTREQKVDEYILLDDMYDSTVRDAIQSPYPFTAKEFWCAVFGLVLHQSCFLFLDGKEKTFFLMVNDQPLVVTIRFLGKQLKFSSFKVNYFGKRLAGSSVFSNLATV